MGYFLKWRCCRKQAWKQLLLFQVRWHANCTLARVHFSAVLPYGLWQWSHSTATTSSSRVSLPNQWQITELFFAFSVFGCSHLHGLSLHSLDGTGEFEGNLRELLRYLLKIPYLKILMPYTGIYQSPNFSCYNRYVPEGNMTACGTDYLNKDWFSRSYILIYSVFVYFMPLLLIIYSYFFIVQVSAIY